MSMNLVRLLQLFSALER